MIRLLFAAAVLVPMAHAQEPPAHHDHGTAWFHRIDAELGYSGQDGGAFEWDVHGWIGGDSERVWLRSEGEYHDGRTETAEAQLYYGWNVDEFWDVLVGVRHDVQPDARTYAAVGLVGMTEYFLETEATLFVSDEGRVSARFEQHVEFNLTQRLILAPSWELNAIAQDDPARGLGAGLTDIELTLQLRYEIAREFAPFVEIAWERRLGETAQIARASGDGAEDTTIRAGLKIWF